MDQLGNFELIQILNFTEDSALPNVCQLSPRLVQLCQSDDYWRERTIYYFGKNSILAKSRTLNQGDPSVEHFSDLPWKKFYEELRKLSSVLEPGKISKNWHRMKFYFTNPPKGLGFSAESLGWLILANYTNSDNVFRRALIEKRGDIIDWLNQHEYPPNNKWLEIAIRMGNLPYFFFLSDLGIRLTADQIRKLPFIFRIEPVLVGFVDETPDYNIRTALREIENQMVDPDPDFQFESKDAKIAKRYENLTALEFLAERGIYP